ncbi:MAG: hypothetical protein E7484_03885 [Ruminococcaceae bacterium]|nr:hypothetical protein [Oscillospiraceae bacterium]
MTIGLMVLIGLLSAGILVGRVYEILKLTDETTGFFLYKGIVFNPYILIIFIIITLCCTVLVLGSCKNSRPFFSQSSKLIAVAAGVMFVIYGVMSVKSAAFAPFVIAGGAAFVIIGTAGLKADAGIADAAAVVLSIVFAAGLCLDVIIFNVNTISNIDFTKNALSYIAVSLLMLSVMKNVYSPSAKAKMFLFATGITAFMFCGVMHVADIIAMAAKGQAVLPDLFLHAGFGFVGFFAFDNAVSVMSKKVQQAASESEKTAEQNADVYKAAEKQHEIPAAAKTGTIFGIQADSQSVKQKEIAEFFRNSTDKTQETTVETTNKRMVFTRTSADKKTAPSKDGGKVVYKKPKN